MELYQLRYFERVAYYESISRAAAELHLTQPALSKSIAKLEEELGVKLFDRDGKRLHINECGIFFLRSVERILWDLDDSARSLARLTEGLEGNLRIGIFGPQQGALACAVSFMQQNPGIRVAFDARQSTATRHLVREYDVVFYQEGRMFDDLSGISYATSHLKLAVPNDHPLARCGIVALSDLKDEQFIFSNTTAGVYELGYQLCMQSGFYPAIRAVTSSGAAQIEMIRAGLGIGFVDGLMQEQGIEGLTTVDLDIGSVDQALCFACAPFSSLTPIAQRFVTFAFEHFGIPFDARAQAVFDGN